LIRTNPGLLPHTHIQFGHCYKQQDGWPAYLSRFSRGGGTLYDIEFLVGENGRRVAAFGYYAGYAGAAVSLLAWAHQISHPGTALGAVDLYPSAPDLVADVKARIA
jgi:saccharopine dehydrogenase (NAD+, L-lysine-forming)